MSTSDSLPIVLASHNPGKVREFRQLLAGAGFKVEPQSAFAVPAVAETGLSFVENAILKARHSCAHTGLAAIADDSGLEVDALGGEPGIVSARFAGEGATDAANNQRLLTLLKDVPEQRRRARFQCLLVYMRHDRDPTPIICQGTWEGRILFEPEGEQGFGYDPLFWVAEKGCTSAQLDKTEKNTISHRGKAMAQLLRQLSAMAPVGHSLTIDH